MHVLAEMNWPNALVLVVGIITYGVYESIKMWKGGGPRDPD